MPSFLDTNVLVYLASDDAAKADRAEQLVQAGGWISVQVLNEATQVLRGKWRHEWQIVRDFLARCEVAFQVVPLNIDVHHVGLEIAERHKLHVFDSMIVAAALLSKCDVLYSEDMHHGLVVDGRLTVVNPFHA